MFPFLLIFVLPFLTFFGVSDCLSVLLSVFSRAVVILPKMNSLMVLFVFSNVFCRI